MAKILVIDDDPVMQMTARVLLEQAGHRVVIAGDGRQGGAALKTGSLGLCFSLFFTPAMDGLQTVRGACELPNVASRR
jgi:CheY-like chemotaxis protein